MIIGDMEIRLRADIARLQRDMDDARRVVGDATAAMGRAADIAKSALAGIAGAVGLAKIAEMSDSYAKLTAQLRLATDSTSAYAKAYADVKRIANSSQTDLAATGSLYASLTRATKDLNTSQQSVADITEAVNLSLKISGAGAQESAGAILQLSQAFAAGALRGDEFNSVAEAAPRLMQAIADSMGLPVGALRSMAEQGKLTADVVAKALPQALGTLRSEAGQIQTISGAFTALKNNALEFVGVQAQASGVVTVLTGGIGLLADNLTVVAGAAATVTAVKIGGWLSSLITGAANAVTANRALAASTLASAEADAVATAQASLLANARLAEARAATLAAAGETQLALTTNALIPAQARATAMAEAHELAMTRLSLAQRAASLSTTAASSVITALGGPLGALVTVLGLAATAWAWYKQKQDEANATAKGDIEQSTGEILDGLKKQNDKLRERVELSKKVGMADAANQGGPAAERAAELLKRINELKAQGAAISPGDSVALIDYEGQYADLKREIGANEELKRTLDANGKAASDLLAVRQRLSGVNQQYLDDLTKLQTAFEKGAISQDDYVAAVSKLAKDTYEGSTTGKQYAQSLDAQAEAIQRAAEAQGIRNQRDQEHIEFLKNSGQANEETTIRAAAAARIKDFNDQIAEQQRLLALDNQRQATAEQHAQKKAEIAGKIGVLRLQIDSAQKKRDEDLFLAEQKQYRQAVANYADKLEAAQAETKAQQDRVRDGQDEIDMLGMTAKQIAELTASRLRDRAALLDQAAATEDVLDATHRLGDESRKQAEALRTQANQVLTKDVLGRQKELWSQIEATAHDTFISIFDSGKSAFDRLRDTLKNGLLELLYQMTVKQWIFNIGASVGMTGSGAVAQAAGMAGGGFGSAGGSLLGSAAGSLFGAGGLSGSLAAGAGWMTGATTLTGSLSAAGSLIGTGTAGGIMSGIGMGVGALGPLALGAAGLYSLAKGLDHSGTPHTGGASSADQYGNVSTVRAESLNFEKTAVSDATNQFTAGIASSVVSILNGTAAAFGKTAAYSASAAFADDSSEDGAWGGLVIKQAGQKVLNWQDTRTSRWAPKEFADGEEGQKQYLAEVSKSVRAQLDAIGLPGWAKGMLDQLGNAPALADLAKTVDTINATEKALAVMGERLVGFGNLSDDAVSALMSASGGIEALAANASAYYDAFYSDAEKTKVLSDQVADALQKAGVTMPATREAYREQVEAQLALGSAGAPAAAALLGVAGAINEIYPAATSATKSLQQIADERKPLQDQLDELLMTSAQLLAKQRDALDDSNKALFDQVQAAQKVRTAQDAAKSSLGDFITQMKSFATTAKGLNSSLVLGELSTLTPEQQYAEARRQFELTRQQAAAGDTTAQGNLQSIEQTFLQLSQKLNGGDAQYSSDLATVMRTNDELAQWATQSVDVAQSSLDALNNSAATLTDISATLTAIANGVQYLPAALSGQDVTSYAQAFAAIDYSSIGTSNMTALVDEIKALRTSNEAMAAELKGLRADQQKQTGDLIQAGATSADKAAEKVVEGVHDAITDGAYAEAHSTRRLK